MAGTSLLLHALPNIAHEENYEKAMAALGLSDAPPEERVKALLGMPGEELVAKLPPGIAFAPALDGDLILPGTTYTEIAKPGSSFLPGKEWCQDLLIGNNEIDVCWNPSPFVCRLTKLLRIGKHLRFPCATDQNADHQKVYCCNSQDSRVTPSSGPAHFGGI